MASGPDRRAQSRNGDYAVRQPPFDFQSESGVIGSIFLLPQSLAGVRLLIEADDFYDQHNREIFTVMVALAEQNRPLDPTLIIDALKARGTYNAAELSKALNAVPNAAHATYYAEIVQEKSRLRRLITACTEGLRDAYDELPSGDVADAVTAKLNIRDRDASKAEPLSTVWGRVIDDLQSQVGKPEPPAMLSGLPGADNIGFLFCPGELTIVAARPGGGKTALAKQVALHQAKKGRPVLFASLEMASESLGARSLYAEAGINGQSIRRRGVDQQTVDDLRRVRESTGDLPLYLWAPGRVKVTTISAMAAAIHAKHKIRMLVADYTSWIVADDRKAERRDQVGEIIKGLRAIGQRLKIAVLLLHQLNRESGSGKPELTHLRESGCAEEDADAVFGIWHPEPGRASLIVLKNRHGASGGEVSLRWHPEVTRFSEMEITDRPNYEPSFDEWNNQ